MHSIGRAILWQISWRSRWGLAALSVYMLAAIVLSHTLPANLRVEVGDNSLPAVGWFLGMPGLLGNIILMAVFAMTGNDAKNSGFTTHMFILPLRTSTLVAWPMFSGCVAVSVVWVLTATLVYRPGGIEAPLLWPAAALAAFLAAFQAVTWTPFVQRWLQLVLLVAVIMSPVALMPVCILLNIQMSEPLIALLLIGLIPVAYVAALSGVARARRGDAYDWRLWSRFVEWITARGSRTVRPFASWRTAHLWFECRSHVWTVPMFLGATMCCTSYLPFIGRDDVEQGWRVLGILLAAPLVIALLAGGLLGNLHDPLSKAETANFVLTRPISCFAIVRSKLAAAAVCTAAIWLVMLAFVSLMLFRPGFAEALLGAARRLPAWQAVGLPLLILTLLMAMTWKNMIENLWVNLTGRAWVGNAYTFGCVALVSGGIGAGLWIYFQPELHAPARAAVPWMIGLLLALKAIVAISVLRALQRWRIIRMPTAAAMLGGWCLLVLGLCLLAWWALPPGVESFANILCGVALLVPFSRVAGAPLALAWNRHR